MCQITVPDLITGLTGTDNCGTVTFTQLPIAGTMITLTEGGTTTVVITANDGNGNTTPCNVVLTGDDLIAPVFTCPGPQTLSLDAMCKITVPDLITGLTGTDNCGTVTFTQLPAAGSLINASHNSTTMVTIIANDGNGNESNCIVTLTANDNTAPVFSVCQTDILNFAVNAALCKGSVTLTAPTVTDNCTYTLTWVMTGDTPGSGTGNIPSPFLFNAGTTVVTYTAKDGANNMAMCSFTITVLNNIVGTITGGGTTTVNAPSSVNVTFTGSGGTAPYTFYYKIGAGGITQIITTSMVSSVVSIAHPTNIAGTFEYILLGVTDANGCNGILAPMPPQVTVNIIMRIDLSPTIPAPLNSNFLSTDPNRQGYIQFTNGGDGPTSGAVSFRISKIANFAITIPPLMMTSGDFPFTVNVDNTQWTITDGTFFFTVTAAMPNIPAGGNVKIGFILDPTGPPGSTGNLTATIFNGAGGDINDNNNASIKTFVIN
jgi:hypothetical protein